MAMGVSGSTARSGPRSGAHARRRGESLSGPAGTPSHNRSGRLQSPAAARETAPSPRAGRSRPKRLASTRSTARAGRATPTGLAAATAPRGPLSRSPPQTRRAPGGESSPEGGASG